MSNRSGQVAMEHNGWVLAKLPLPKAKLKYKNLKIKANDK